MPRTLEETLEAHLSAEARHDAAAAAATYVEDGFYENAALGVRLEGRNMVELQYAMSYAFIENMTATFQWEQTFGDIVVHCGRITGTAGTEFMGVKGRGGPMDLPFTAVLRFRDGEMLGEHVYFDLAQFCEQAGLDIDEVRAAAAALAGAGAATG